VIAAVFLLCLAIGVWAWSGSRWLRGRPVRQHLSAGMEFARQGQGPQAETEWKEALRLDPHSTDACRLLAEYYMSARAWQNAVAALQRLRALSPREEHIDCRLAACYLNLGDEIGAFRLSETELKRDPNCGAALATSSILLDKMGEQPRAIGYLRRLSQLEPNDPTLEYMLGEALTDTFDYRGARPVLERVTRLDPSNADAYAELGIGWLDDASAPDHLQRAEQVLRKALELNPLHADARLALGKLHLRRNQARPAITQLTEAARLMPNSSKPPFELAKAYDLAGEPAKAAQARQQFVRLRTLSSRIGALEKRCSINPTVFEYPLELGQIELRQGDYRKAYVWLHKAQALRPRDPRVTAALAELSRMSTAPARMDAVQDRISQPSPGGPATTTPTPNPPASRVPDLPTPGRD
jgi:tetratricopeptide (TPR) repeat protein